MARGPLTGCHTGLKISGTSGSVDVRGEMGTRNCSFLSSLDMKGGGPCKSLRLRLLTSIYSTPVIVDRTVGVRST